MRGVPLGVTLRAGDATTTVVVGTATGLHRVGGGVGGGTALAPEPVTAIDGEWVVTGGHTLWRGPERVAELDGPAATCVLATADGVFVGTEEARLLRFVDGVVEQVVSFDEAEGRDRWYTPWGGPPDVRSLSAGDDGSVYVNVHVGGILRSTDGGRAWHPTIDVDSDVHQVVAADGVVLAATAYGLARSTDGGANWEFLTDGLHATYSRAVTAAGRAVLVSASRGPGGQDSAVYRLADGGFERCRDGLPEWFAGNVDTACLAACDQTVAVGTGDGSVFVSTDGGGRWDRVADGLGRVTCLTVG